MRAARRRLARRNAGMAGFTLVETLAAVALTGVIIASLAVITAQWLPNWKRGFARVQRTEDLRLGLERIVADLAAAEFITPNGETNAPLFMGAELSTVFVRSALGPNSPQGLEIIRLSETADDQGFALVRERAPFVPLAMAAGRVALPTFSDPVVLVRAPFRIRFAYAGEDRSWRDSWGNTRQLPSAVRVSVRVADTDQILSVSTSTRIHADIPVACVTAKSATQCLDQLRKGDQPQAKSEEPL